MFYILSMAQKNKKQMFVFILGIVALTLAISGCNNNATGEISRDVNSFGSVDKEFNVKAFRFGFEPSTIRVSKGDKVRINVESIDVTHGFSIEGYDINLYVDGLGSESVEFVADKAGRFMIYCSVPCGSGHGSMRGVLIVE
jgi:cytochrome c oxidase subunit 2